MKSRECQVKISSNTPPGYNKSCREQTKLLLTATAVSLLTGNALLATIISAAAVLVLKQGTLFSTKNIKWGSLSIISFVVSLTVAIFIEGFGMVNEDKAYTLKMTLWLTAKFLQVFWSVVLGLFLLSTYTTEPTIE